METSLHDLRIEAVMRQLIEFSLIIVFIGRSEKWI
jgi:hypothetical protein